MGKINVITAALTMLFAGCLLWGRLPLPVLLCLCAGLGVFVALGSGQRGKGHDGGHRPFVPADVLAQRSRLRNINPMLKFWTLFILTVASVASRGVGTGFLLGAVMPVLAVSWGGLRIHQYARLLVLPVSFLLLGGMALLWEVSAQPMGILSLPVGGAWLCVTPQGQARTVLVICRALGAVSCLCLLSVTTPMPEIIGVLRRARCPALVVDLMYLVYRYIFILLSLYHDMRDAAKSRLGFRDLRTSLRAGGKIYANVLARSYQWAGKNFDAMESRCYDAGIRFLERPGAVTWPQVSGAVVLVLGSWGLGLLPLGLPV